MVRMPRCRARRSVLSQAEDSGIQTPGISDCAHSVRRRGWCVKNLTWGKRYANRPLPTAILKRACAGINRPQYAPALG